MRKYKKYVDRLTKLVARSGSDLDTEWKEECRNALDGEPNRELRKALSVAARRKLGAFFTGSRLAQRALKGKNGMKFHAYLIRHVGRVTCW